MRRLLVIAVGVLVAMVCVGAIVASTTAPPPIRISAPGTVEAVDSTGADVTYNVQSDLAEPVECDPGDTQTGDFSVTVHLALGAHTITCTSTADGSITKSTSVTVVDTTAPTFSGMPSNIIDSTTDPNGTPETYTPPTATDAVDGPVSVTCSPSSGSTFAVGTTTVTCSASDSRGNIRTQTFTVTITFSDSTPPVFTSAPADVTTEATSASGAVVTFSTPSATDDSGSVTVTCSPPSGSTFALGSSTVTCTATDPSGNSKQTSFQATVADTTPPSLSLPSDITVGAPGPVTYSATATDLVDGSVAVNCNHPSGSTFGFGTTAVNCSATDAHGRTASGSFNVTVADNAGPTFSNVPGTLTREANGPSGSVVTYTTPTAVDNVDGPRLVSCAPMSGSTFPLGTTTVTCSASDNQGNNSNAQFSISVVDTTPPNLIAPDGWNAYATTDAGIPINEAAASGFVHGAFVSDAVDPHPTVTTDAPALFPVGKTTVVFTARDASGNTRSATATITVRPKPADGTTPEPLPPAPDRIPPDEVKNLAAAAGDGAVTLTWGRPTAADFAQVKVTRSLNAGGGDTVVYTGSAARFVDRSVENGVEYRYVVVAVDANGNASAGVAVSATPVRSVLRTPKEGAVVKKPPKFVWLAFADATYYNFQLFRGTTKILSAWPKKPTITLKKTWKFEGRKYKLTPGVYRWYVWPGLGTRAAATYGDMLGSSTFTVSR